MNIGLPILLGYYSWMESSCRPGPFFPPLLADTDINFFPQHESVSECCVLGLPDKDYGEIVCAIIVPHEDAKRKAEQESKPAITLNELQGWSKEKLAPYKVILQNYFSVYLLNTVSVFYSNVCILRIKLLSYRSNCHS